MGCGGDIKEKENKPHERIEDNKEESKKDQQEKEKLEKEQKEKKQKEKEQKVKKDKEKEKKEKQRTDIDLDTADFKEENYPLFSSNFFEKFIKNIRKTIIEKNQDGSFKVHKLCVTLDYNKKITKIVKIEKDSSGQKHLIQKFLKGECSLEKVKEDLVKYNDEYHIETNQLL